MWWFTNICMLLAGDVRASVCVGDVPGVLHGGRASGAIHGTVRVPYRLIVRVRAVLGQPGRVPSQRGQLPARLRQPKQQQLKHQPPDAVAALWTPSDTFQRVQRLVHQHEQQQHQPQLPTGGRRGGAAVRDPVPLQTLPGRHRVRARWLLPAAKLGAAAWRWPNAARHAAAAFGCAQIQLRPRCRLEATVRVGFGRWYAHKPHATRQSHQRGQQLCLGERRHFFQSQVGLEYKFTILSKTLDRLCQLVF